MKLFLTFLIIFCASISYSQNIDDIGEFYGAKNVSDRTLQYFMGFLDKFAPKDRFKNFYCEQASERVGDYYRSKQEYLKAIAYYDSTDTKYRNKTQICGNSYYSQFIPRRYKISQCYLALNEVKKAIATLTPLIFERFGSRYFDTTMTSFYENTLKFLYSKEEIRCHMQNAIDNIQYTTFYRWTLDSSAKFLNVSCKLQLFDTEIEMAGFETASDTGQVPYHTKKDFFIRELRGLEIYKKLVN